jgi:hypothetical protein
VPDGLGDFMDALSDPRAFLSGTRDTGINTLSLIYRVYLFNGNVKKLSKNFIFTFL